MDTIAQLLGGALGRAFERAGYEARNGAVVVSDRPDLAQFQCNGALAVAKQRGLKPRVVADSVLRALSEDEAARDFIGDVSLAGAGFINLRVNDAWLARQVAAQIADERYGCRVVDRPSRVIIDFGGPNVAKPMHVGHLRSSIIGESLKRIARFLGREVVGDVHLGDWGLQMGVLISALRREQPTLAYFEEGRTEGFPEQSPVTVADLQELYPKASALTKNDPVALEEARTATRELQQGRPGYRALWRHFVEVSLGELEPDFAALGVSFNLWLGESDVSELIPSLVERLRHEGWAHESEGALVIDVSSEDDKEEIPPLMLIKSDGAVLYGTTDLATISKRVGSGAEQILYVVDNRQAGHFRQVFRAAYRTGIAPVSVVLEHVSFGTMNGKDGKPFKTRAGGVMRLRDLIQMVTDKARERMAEADVARDYPELEREQIAHDVGLAALKYADLMNHRARDYVFDLDRFSAFEGRTGPYLLYAAVRIRSILRKALERGFKAGPLLAPQSDAERAVLLELAKLPQVVELAFEARLPNHLADYAFQLSQVFNRFYKDHHVLREEDEARRESWLGLCAGTVGVLELVLQLLGLNVPYRM